MLNDGFVLAERARRPWALDRVVVRASGSTFTQSEHLTQGKWNWASTILDNHCSMLTFDIDTIGPRAEPCAPRPDSTLTAARMSGEHVPA